MKIFGLYATKKAWAAAFTAALLATTSVYAFDLRKEYNKVSPVKIDEGGRLKLEPPKPSDLVVPPGPFSKPLQDVLNEVTEPTIKAVNDVKSAAEEVARDFDEAARKAGRDFNTAVIKAGKDINNTVITAYQDSEATVGKAGQDVEGAAHAIGRFVEREIQSKGKSLSDAQRRVLEGKVVDAFWHLGTDPLNSAQKNAALAAQESQILNTVGQIAATAYGGPGGAAAYAAWYTYHATGGNVEMAMKMALISGAASAGFSAVGTLPTDGASQVARKAILAGAVGGLAVAAAGGGPDDVKEAFLMSGGMIIVQATYDNVTGQSLDARASRGEASCMAATTMEAACAPSVEAYRRDDGSIRTNAKGQPVADVTKTDPRLPHVGTWTDETYKSMIGAGERSGLMTGLSKVPAVNAMAYFHDAWSVSWQMDPVSNVVTILPAAVLTYVGTGAPVYDKLLEQGSSKDAQER